jgi:hypothetical protein
VTFQCRLDSAPFGSCSGPGASHTTAPLADGSYTIHVRAVDAAGNPGAHASRTFTVDTAAPQTTITSGPTGLTNDSNPEFAFASSEISSAFECSIDDVPFVRCGPRHTTPSLSDGSHVLHVRATDPAGNTDPTPASRAFTVAAVRPDTVITSGPIETTTDRTPTFEFSSTSPSSTFECRVDRAAFEACGTPHTTVVLRHGLRNFEVRAIDVLGNVDPTPASRSFTVSEVPPPSAQPRSITLRTTSGRRAELAGLPLTRSALVEFAVFNPTATNLPPTRFKITRGSAKLSGRAPSSYAAGHWTTAVPAGSTARLALRVQATRSGKVAFAITPPAQPSLTSTYDVATDSPAISSSTTITRRTGPRTVLSGIYKSASCTARLRFQIRSPTGSWIGVRQTARVRSRTTSRIAADGDRAQTTTCRWTLTMRFTSSVFAVPYVGVRAVTPQRRHSRARRVPVRA